MDSKVKNSVGSDYHFWNDCLRFSNTNFCGPASWLGWLKRIFCNDNSKTIYYWSAYLEKTGSIAVLAAGLSGCALPSVGKFEVQSGEPKLELQFKVNGQYIDGIGMAQANSDQEYNISIISKDSREAFRFSTCHRDIYIGKEFVYKPTSVEKTGYCPFLISAISTKSYREGFADSSDLTIPATLQCNGVTESVVGATVCQSKSNLIQELVFTSPVGVGSQSGSCPQPVSLNGMDWRIRLGTGYCVYAFREKATDNIFRLTTYGYETWHH